MKRKTILNSLITALITITVLVSTAILAGAVPAAPGADISGAAARCRSHHGELVTLDSIPTRRGGATLAPSISHVTKKAFRC